MNDDTRAYSITGSLEKNYGPVVETTVGTAPRKFPRGDRFFASSSSEVYDTVSYGKVQQRRALDRIMLGQSGSAPTWTHAGVGANQAFYAAPFSSSHHERDVMNVAESGAFAELGVAVPVSSTLFYQKNRRTVHQTYKLSASSDLGATGLGPSAFIGNVGALVHFSASVERPAVYKIEVPDNGRLLDVKVWVEIVHISSSDKHPPLGGMAIALRSPNVSWPTGHAHPMRNFKLGLGVSDALHTTMQNYGQYYNDTYEDVISDPYARNGPIEFYRNSYLLWEPGAVMRVSPAPDRLSIMSQSFYNDGTSGTYLGRPDPACENSCWDRDRHMRVVFSDGSRVKNPRDITTNFIENIPLNNVVGAPNAYFGINRSLGGDRPWIADINLELEPLGNTGSFSSPPKGWLTGPGGTNDVNEWPTTGSSYGTNEIRPVYPLLEGIIEKKLTMDETNDNAGVVRGTWRTWVSPTRPGLRDSQISGTWELLVALQSSSVPQALTYFRQWRLELIYEQNHDRKFSLKTKKKRSGSVPAKKGLRLYQIVSGSGISDLFDGDSFADRFPNAVYVDYGEEIELGRTIGLITNSSSLETADFAVYTASASLEFVSSSADRNSIIEVLRPSNPLAGPKILPSFIRSKGTNLTLEESARIIFSGST